MSRPPPKRSPPRDRSPTRLPSPKPAPKWTWGIGGADWICVGVLLAVTFAFFWKGLFDPVGMAREDAAYLSQPYYQYAADEVRSGRFPHWNPYAACGMPYHATLQGQVLYPLRWPMFWMSYQTGYAVSLWIHYFLTGVFTFLFIRMTLRCGPLPALIGAVSFAFCGFMMGHLTHWNYFQAYPWFVLAVVLLSQAIRRSSWIWAVGAAMPVGLIALIGAVHIILILGFGLGLWAVAETTARLVRRLWRRHARLSVRKPSGQPLPPSGPGGPSPAHSLGGGTVAAVREVIWPAIAIGIALVLGFAIGAAQLWPAQIQTNLSTRTATTWEFITEICAHPARSFVRLTAPFYWGNYQLGYWGENSWHEQAFYAGIVPLILAVVGAVACIRERWVLRLLILCLVAAVVAAGKYLPVFRLLYDYVPGFNRLRDPARLFVWVDFAIACLGAIGAQRLLEADRARLPRRALVGALVAGGVCLIVIVACLVSLGQMVGSPGVAADGVRSVARANEGERANQLKDALRVSAEVMRNHDAATWFGVAAGIASCVLCGVLVALRRRLTAAVGGVLVALLVLDLGMFSAGSLQYSKYDALVVKRPGYVEFMQRDPGFGRYVCWRGPEDQTNRHRGMLFRIPHAISGPGGIFHTPRQSFLIGLNLPRFFAVPAGVDANRIDEPGMRILIPEVPQQAQGRVVLLGYCDRVTALEGVRYLICDFPVRGPGVKTVLQDGEAFVIEDSSALPRAFLARQVEVLQDPNLVWEKIVGLRRNASDLVPDLADVALLEQSVEPLPPVTGPPDPNEIPSIERPAPSRLLIRTKAPGPRQLVLTETYNPEWKCRIDGQMTPVYLTDYSFMSVRVPGGEHEVLWWYEPAGFKMGLAVTAAACALVAGAFGVRWLLRRRVGKQPSPSPEASS